MCKDWEVTLPIRWKLSAGAAIDPAMLIPVNWLARHWKNAVVETLVPCVALAILIFALVGCGALPNYFPTYPQHFDLAADGTGALTHVEMRTGNPLVVNGHAIDSMGGVDMRFTKDNIENMPESGVPNATMDWVMTKSPNGQWTGVESIVGWQNPGYPVTTVVVEFKNWDDVSKMIIPAFGVKAGTYLGYGSDWYGGWTPNGYVPEHVQFASVLWAAVISFPTVQTPFYSGPTLANEIHECAMPISLSEIYDPLKCSIETWYFAPNIGLVEVYTQWAPLPCEPYCPPGTQIPPFPPKIRRIN